MSRTYYVIELTARWLTALLVGFALLVAAVFTLGYGAAWSVLGGDGPGPPPSGPVPTPTVTAVVVAPTAIPDAVPTPSHTATPVPRPTEPPAPTVTPVPPTQPPPSATPAAGDDRRWVQVLASSRSEAVEEARRRLERLGFPREHQEVVETAVAGGNVLYKVRVGPFPDRDSADRVVLRMQAAGFPDAWVVTP